MADYSRWTKKQLRAECKTRGLKTAGSNDVLVERLTNNDDYRQQTTGKFIRDDAYHALGERLMTACAKGSLADVRSAIAAHANVNYADRQSGTTPLMQACSRLDGEDIVRELLAYGAVVMQCDVYQETSLHHAARYSMPAAVELLMQAGAALNARSAQDSRPIDLCCARGDEYDARVAEILLASNSYCADDKSFYIALEHGSMELVTLLMRSEHVIRCIRLLKKPRDEPILHMALKLPYATEIIPLLIESGLADIRQRDYLNRTALEHAFIHGYSEAFLLLSSYYDSIGEFVFKDDILLPGRLHSNPVEVLGIAISKYGYRITPKTIQAAMRDDDYPARMFWAILRCCDHHDMSMFSGIAKCYDAQKWRYLGLERFSIIDRSNDQTLFHIAVAADNLVGVNTLMSLKMNPFLRCNKRHRPIDYCKAPMMSALLRAYMVPSVPHEHAMRWYGPFVRERVRSCWIIAKRHGIPRDVICIIVRSILKWESERL